MTVTCHYSGNDTYLGVACVCDYLENNESDCFDEKNDSTVCSNIIFPDSTGAQITVDWETKSTFEVKTVTECPDFALNLCSVHGPH